MIRALFECRLALLECGAGLSLLLKLLKPHQIRPNHDPATSNRATDTAIFNYTVRRTVCLPYSKYARFYPLALSHVIVYSLVSYLPCRHTLPACLCLRVCIIYVCLASYCLVRARRIGSGQTQWRACILYLLRLRWHWHDDLRPAGVSSILYQSSARAISHKNVTCIMSIPSVWKQSTYRLFVFVSLWRISGEQNHTLSY